MLMVIQIGTRKWRVFMGTTRPHVALVCRPTWRSGKKMDNGVLGCFVYVDLGSNLEAVFARGMSGSSVLATV